MTNKILLLLVDQPLPAAAAFHYRSDRMPAPRSLRNRSNKFDKNINKRGHVPIGKAAEHVDDPPISKTLIFFFMFVVVGSSIVQVLRMFQTSAPNFEE
ncbi:hypothetical protein ACHAXH_006267 [Discostella pseudostelligera]